MADDDRSPPAETWSEAPGAAAEEFSQPATPGAAAQPEEPAESSAKGVLREAIQKVMEEIAYHEREAQRHLQQVEELRKDLRESFAFMLEQEASAKPVGVPEEEPAAAVMEPSPPEEAKPAAVMEKRPRRGRKRAGRRHKGE